MSAIAYNNKKDNGQEKKKKMIINMDPMYKMKGKFYLLFILQKNYFVLFVKRFLHMIQDMIKQIRLK